MTMVDSSDSSLLQRAEKLRALARAAAESSGDSQAREKAVRAIDDLSVEVGHLQTTLQTLAAAQSAGLGPSVDRSNLTRAAHSLRQHMADVGRPSAEKIRGSLASLRRERRALDEGLAEQWKLWAGRELDRIPTEKMPLLPQHERIQRQEALRRLQSDAGQAPTAGVIKSFTNSVSVLSSRLSEISTGDALASALRRVQASPAPTLADLTDDELRALREDSAVAAQIVLTRRR